MGGFFNCHFCLHETNKALPIALCDTVVPQSMQRIVLYIIMCALNNGLGIISSCRISKLGVQCSAHSTTAPLHAKVIHSLANPHKHYVKVMRLIWPMRCPLCSLANAFWDLVSFSRFVFIPCSASAFRPNNLIRRVHCLAHTARNSHCVPCAVPCQHYFFVLLFIYRWMQKY